MICPSAVFVVVSMRWALMMWWMIWRVCCGFLRGGSTDSRILISLSMRVLKSLLPPRSAASWRSFRGWMVFSMARRLSDSVVLVVGSLWMLLIASWMMDAVFWSLWVWAHCWSWVSFCSRGMGFSPGLCGWLLGCFFIVSYFRFKFKLNV